MPPFVPGLDLARSFYTELVQPALASVPHAAALIGPGSEVLGFDTERSTDHHWGPRVLVFLPAAAMAQRPALCDLLANTLPPTFRGWSTNWGPADEVGVQLLVDADGGPIAHRVEIHEAGEWFRDVLGFDPAEGVALADWLATPTQLLASVTAGEVYADAIDALTLRRAAVAWYPPDVWRYLVGCQWQRISQEEAFVGRAAEAGDELGGRVVAARLTRDLVRLCFLLERQYAPYSKWLGSAFRRLACANVVAPLLERDEQLGAAMTAVARLHNASGVSEPVDPELRSYYGRPYQVLHATRFADACFAAITDPAVAGLPRGVGAVDQWIDNTNVLSAPRRARRASSGVHEVEHRL